MKVELLHIADCPNVAAARGLLRKTLRELQLPDELHEIEVRDPAHAQALRFPGSPTLRIDDIDVEPALAQHAGYGLGCRTYMIGGQLKGLPTPEMVRDAIRSAVSAADVEAKSL